MYTMVEKQVIAELLNDEVATLLHTNKKQINFDFNYDGGHTTHGQCWKSATGKVKKITISKHLVKNEDIEETILHELCHAYCEDSGHGPQWKRLANVVGHHFGVSITRTNHRERDNDNDGGIVAYLCCPKCGMRMALRRKGTYYHNYQNYGCKCGHKHLVREDVK